ncbi:MAG TPA: hypothetical protein VEZ48_06340 [Sphingomonadaceae bacterium]|nr:hypothetical protein [Sphingomonadaceae bacterium]
MAQIIQFPGRRICAPLRIRSGSLHVAWVRVIDRDAPEEARWRLQYAMQRAAGFGCLDGFNDEVARRRAWHEFEIKKTWLLRRFLRDIAQLVAERRVQVEIDDVRVRPAAAHAA